VNDAASGSITRIALEALEADLVVTDIQLMRNRVAEQCSSKDGRSGIRESRIAEAVRVLPDTGFATEHTLTVIVAHATLPQATRIPRRHLRGVTSSSRSSPVRRCGSSAAAAVLMAFGEMRAVGI
jgi:hypothetical protein